MTPANPAVWFEIYVNDIDRAQGFYEEVFQTKLRTIVSSDELTMLGFPSDMEKPGCSGAICKMRDFDAGKPSSTIVYFSSPDCSVEESRIESAGGRIHRPKMSIGEYGYITLAYDTEGNMFGIHSME